MRTTLLATDLDGTLIGDKAALSELNILISSFRDQGLLKLAYVTGRSLESYCELKSMQSLLDPDALITAVGTEIYLNGTALVKVWPGKIMWDKNKIIRLLNDIPDLVQQEDIAQRPYRIAFYLENNVTETLDLIHQRIDTLPVDVIYSHSKYIDIVPKNINKGSALDSLASLWKIDKANVVACGDSANDILMLGGRKAIIVGNALKELKEWALMARNKGNEVYFAEHSFAAGIAEGFKHYQIVQ